jgi:hypothetical protein|tara:strand:- start:2447 stop:2920 length:474 start_codon:yes stop_codon:yes gene_type:complete
MVQAKFPLQCKGIELDVTQQKILLQNLIGNVIMMEGYVPDTLLLQRLIQDIYECTKQECRRRIVSFFYINEQVQTNTAMRYSEYKHPDKEKLNKEEKDRFDKLKKVKTSGTCSICLKEGFRGVQLACGHVFHKQCIKKAFQYQKKCPNCKIKHLFTV